MIHKFIFALILCSIVIVPSIAISSTTIDGNVVGSLTVCHSTSMEVAGTNLMRFGANQSQPYTYDGSQISVLTNGRTQYTGEVVIDQADSNYYAATGTLITDYMGMAEDTAGMLNIQPNEPDNMCDTDGFLDGSGTSTGSYPYSESFEGRTGAVFHDGGAYQSEVGLNDGNVHLSGAADIESKGYLYQNKIITSLKGFDKNSTALNLATSETMNVIARTAIVDGESEVHSKIVSDYTSIEDAFDDVIAVEEVNQSITTISSERVSDEMVNSTIEVNESVNATPVELPEQFHGESKGLAEISNQSIIRE